MGSRPASGARMASLEPISAAATSSARHPEFSARDRAPRARAGRNKSCPARPARRTSGTGSSAGRQAASGKRGGDYVSGKRCDPHPAPYMWQIPSDPNLTRPLRSTPVRREEVLVHPYRWRLLTMPLSTYVYGKRSPPILVGNLALWDGVLDEITGSDRPGVTFNSDFINKHSL